jgi:hypothetical protein
MRSIFVLVVLAALLIPLAHADASCGGCKAKCGSCKPACAAPANTCQKCASPCASKCSPCKPKCESKCSPCKPKCESKCSPCKPKCESKCSEPCDKGCPKPCACFDWVPYCGCEMVNSLCISLEAACEAGTAGPIKLQLRDRDFKTVAVVELAGPIEGYYTMTYTFAEPVRADSLVEAVIINETEDPVTLTWFNVVGNFECGSYTYFDKSCPGILIGPGGCPRMVLF